MWILDHSHFQILQNRLHVGNTLAIKEIFFIYVSINCTSKTCYHGAAGSRMCNTQQSIFHHCQSTEQPARNNMIVASHLMGNYESQWLVSSVLLRQLPKGLQ